MNNPNPGAGDGDGFGLARFGQGGESVRGVEVKVGDPQFTLIWDTPVDLDLHVIEPGGKEIYWEDPKGVHGGELDVDNTKGFGPENIYWLHKVEGSDELVKGQGPTGKYKCGSSSTGAVSAGCPKATKWKVRIKHAGSVTVITGRFKAAPMNGARSTRSRSAPHIADASPAHSLSSIPTVSSDEIPRGDDDPPGPSSSLGIAQPSSAKDRMMRIVCGDAVRQSTTRKIGPTRSQRRGCVGAVVPLATGSQMAGLSIRLLWGSGGSSELVPGAPPARGSLAFPSSDGNDSTWLRIWARREVSAPCGWNDRRGRVRFSDARARGFASTSATPFSSTPRCFSITSALSSRDESSPLAISSCTSWSSVARTSALRLAIFATQLLILVLHVAEAGLERADARPRQKALGPDWAQPGTAARTTQGMTIHRQRR